MKNDLTHNTIEFAIDTYLIVLAHSRNKEIIPEFVSYIKELFSKHIPVFLMYLGFIKVVGLYLVHRTFK